MNIYQIQTNIQQLVQMLENEEIDKESFQQAFTNLKDMEIEKIDNIACYVKNLKADIKSLKEEEENLKERRKQKEKTVEKLSSIIHDFMLNSDKKKIETVRNNISIRKTPEKVVISDIEAFYEWAGYNNKELLKEKIEPNLTVIKKSIKEGVEVEFASLQSSTSLNIK